MCVGKENCVKVIVLAKEGYSGIRIAETFCCNQFAVVKILRRWKDTRSTNDLPRTGRPQKSLLHQNHVLWYVSLTNCHLMSPNLFSERSEKSNLDAPSVSARIVCQRLENIDLNRRRMRKLLLIQFQRMC